MAREQFSVPRVAIQFWDRTFPIWQECNSRSQSGLDRYEGIRYWPRESPVLLLQKVEAGKYDGLRDVTAHLQGPDRDECIVRYIPA